MDPILFTGSPAEGHVGFFHLLAIVSGAAVNGRAFCKVLYPGGAAGLPCWAEFWGQSVLSFGITGAQVETAREEVRLPESQAALPGKKPPGPGLHCLYLARWT